jgi:hypothetical protein
MERKYGKLESTVVSTGRLFGSLTRMFRQLGGRNMCSLVNKHLPCSELWRNRRVNSLPISHFLSNTDQINFLTATVKRVCMLCARQPQYQIPNISFSFPVAPTLEHRASVKRFVSLQFFNPATVGTTPWTGDQPGTIFFIGTTAPVGLGLPP